MLTKLPITNTNNFSISRNKRDEFPTAGVYRIVLHTYNGAGRSLFNWFQNNIVQVSAHYAVFKDGNTEQYVDENEKAYHAGHAWWNDVSIGIEHQDDGVPEDTARTDEMYEASAQLVADICLRWRLPVNRTTVVKHSECTTTGCPGGLDVDRIVRRAAEILSVPPVHPHETSPDSVSPDVSAQPDPTVTKDLKPDLEVVPPEIVPIPNLPINSQSMTALLAAFTELLAAVKDMASKKFASLILFEGFIGWAIANDKLPPEKWVGGVALVALIAYFVSNIFDHVYSKKESDAE